MDIMKKCMNYKENLSSKLTLTSQEYRYINSINTLQ